MQNAGARPPESVFPRLRIGGFQNPVTIGNSDNDVIGVMLWS